MGTCGSVRPPPLCSVELQGHVLRVLPLLVLFVLVPALDQLIERAKLNAEAGNRMPGIPRNLLKLRADYRPNENLRGGASVLRAGDEESFSAHDGDAVAARKPAGFGHLQRRHRQG